MTTAEAMFKAGQEPPDYSPPREFQYLVDHFWRLKQFCKEIGDPITPGFVRDWCEDQGVYMTPRDRFLVYTLDYSVRAALSKQRAENDRYFAQKQKKR